LPSCNKKFKLEKINTTVKGKRAKQKVN